MQISIKTNFPDVQKYIDRVGKQARFAAMQSINDTAFKVRDELQREMRAKFDRVTPYILRSVQVTKATKQSMTATIEPKYMGGKGIDPQKILRAQIFGGSRRLKRSEVALNRAGILPAGYVIVPGDAVPLDVYGNVKGGFIVQLISYFQAFGEQGYKANMTAKRKASLAKRGRKQGYKTIGGVEYFVNYGKLRGGRGGKHLHPGIWARTGIHGSDIKPILMFVRAPNYQTRLDFFGVSRPTIDQEFPKFFERRFADALRTAR
ncbi:MAG: hypothetical protein ACRECD_01205 [Burkholderiaceae bacterium]